MKVYLGEKAGFCSGVKIAINKAKEVVLKKEKVYCLGELVHNKQLVASLEKEGMITIDSIEEVPDGETVIFRSHGEPKKSYDRAKEKRLEVVDTTCGNVLAIHKKVETKKDDSFIIILGKNNHPETIGTKGFAGENSFIIETEDDILDAYKEYEKTNLGKVYVVTQTTISSKLCDELIKEVQTNFIEADVEINKTICNATEVRQAETREMSKKFHSMIIIGGKNSSNTRELVKIAQENCKKVYDIETVQELKEADFLQVESVGVTAGASTPKEIIDEVLEFLSKI